MWALAKYVFVSSGLERYSQHWSQDAGLWAGVSELHGLYVDLYAPAYVRVRLVRTPYRCTVVGGSRDFDISSAQLVQYARSTESSAPGVRY